MAAQTAVTIGIFATGSPIPLQVISASSFTTVLLVRNLHTEGRFLKVVNALFHL